MKIKLLIMSILMIVSCEESDDPILKEEIVTSNVTFETYLKDESTFNYSSAQEVVIRSEADENAFFLRNSNPNIESFDVDYDQDMLIGVLLGIQGTGDIYVEIEDLTLDKEVIYVDYSATFTRNAPAVQTYPVHFIKLENTVSEVIFNEMNVIQL